jgi:hypothetical protein
VSILVLMEGLSAFLHTLRKNGEKWKCRHHQTGWPNEFVLKIVQNNTLFFRRKSSPKIWTISVIIRTARSKQLCTQSAKVRTIWSPCHQRT